MRSQNRRSHLKLSEVALLLAWTPVDLFGDSYLLPLGAVSFAASGPVAGTIAGSPFAALQSAAMGGAASGGLVTGVAASTGIVIGASVAVTAGTVGK